MARPDRRAFSRVARPRSRGLGRFPQMRAHAARVGHRAFVNRAANETVLRKAMPNPETGAMGLLCLAGRARIVVPASDILQVIEYPVSGRLPLAARFVGGLGLFDGRVIISVAIDSKPDGAAQR